MRMSVARILFLSLTLFFSSFSFAEMPLKNSMPKDFVYLKDVAPSILQDMRYATYHNFIGHPVQGYYAKECILTHQAAEALKKAQAALLQSHLSLKVYDCYRPQMAVDEFVAWSKKLNDTKMKAEFYPRVPKSRLFELGYIAKKSGHTRGSTVDLTIVPIPTPQQANYYRGQSLVACNAPYLKRYADNSINMGTGFDCLDASAHAFTTRVPMVAYSNRQMLRHVMQKYGFTPYNNEWWHFTLTDEPYKKTYFNFPIRPSS